MSPGPQRGQDHLLEVVPEAVPELRRAFVTALDAVDAQITLVKNEAVVAGWAEDPVSKDATSGVNRLTAEAEGAVLEALYAYRRQLDAAVVNLEKTAEQYRGLEDDNQATVTHTTQG